MSWFVEQAEAKQQALTACLRPFTHAGSTEPIPSAIGRLVRRDMMRCLEQLFCFEACDVSGQLEEVQVKASRYVETRRPILEWATVRWLDATLGATVGSSGLPWSYSSPPTLCAALAPIEPWRLGRAALVVAPRRIFSAGFTALLLWLNQLWPETVTRESKRRRRQRLLEPLMTDVALAYERLG